jgi:hypothetical protein
MFLPLIIWGAILLFKSRQKNKFLIPGILLCLLPIPLWAFVGYHVELHGAIVGMFITIPGYIALPIFGIIKVVKNIKR